MRKALGLVVLLAAGCSRSFVAPQGVASRALSVTPATVSLAPDEVKTLQVQGGVPPYQVSAQKGRGPDGRCGAEDADGGSQVTYAACLRPGLADEVLVVDSVGARTTVPVAVGPAMQALLPAPNVQECSAVQLTITGGAPEYALLPVDGGQVACDGGAFVLRHEDNISRYSFQAPRFSAAGNNTYPLTLADAVESAKALDGGLEPRNVIRFSVVVEPTPVVPQPLTVVSPVEVAPGQSVNLAAAYPRAVSFSLAPDGNSSGCTVDPSGLYTAGSNPDTVDHLLLQDPVLGTRFDVWIEVGNPQVALPTLPADTLLVGDVNADGIDDLLLLGNLGSDRDTGLLIVGGRSGPVLQGALTLPGGASAFARDVVLRDVTGDGRADLLVALQSRGGAPGGSAGNCFPSQGPACTPGGQVDFNRFQISCLSDGDGGLVGCDGQLFDGAGNPAGQVPPSGSDQQFTLTSGGATIGCTRVDGGPGRGPSFVCDQGCATLPGGGHLCDSAWRCGSAGCEPTSAGVACFPQDPTHAICDLAVHPPDGGSGNATCTLTARGTYACGPFTCTDDLHGAFDCGPNDCQVDGSGTYFCVQDVCGFPAAGPAAQCDQPPGQPLDCHACTGWTGGSSGNSGSVEVLQSLAGGGFLDVGAIPSAGQAIPATWEGQVLLLAGGGRVQSVTSGGAVSFASAGPPLPLGGIGDGAMQVVVAHDGSGAPWAVEVVRQEPQSGQSALQVFGALVDGDGGLEPFDGGGLQALITLPSNSRPTNPVLAVELQAGAGESVVLWEEGPGGRLDVIEPPGSMFSGTTVALSALLRDAGAPYPDAPVRQVTALGAIHALALGVQPLNAPVGMQWYLVTQDPLSGDLRGQPWSSLGLPAIDQQRLVTALAAGDFNGDGQADVALATLSRVELLLGSAGGGFVQGERYATPGPLSSLSTTVSQGQGLLAGVAIFGQTVELFAAVQNHAPDGGPTSSLASLATWASQPGLAGAVLRGDELWTGQVTAGGGVQLTRFLDARNPASNTPPIVLNAGALAPVGIGGLFQPDASRPDAAWLLGLDAASRDLVAAHLVATADGGLGVDQTHRTLAGAGRFTSARSVPGGDLELLLFDGTQTERVSASSGAVLGSFGAAQPGFWPGCNLDTPALFVDDSPLLLLEGTSQCSDSADGGGCCNVGNDQAQTFVFDPAQGTLALVAVPTTVSIRPRSAAHTVLADGGDGLLCVGVQSPGAYVLLPGPDGGWQLDPALRSETPALEVIAYPAIDGGPRAHVLSEVSPGALQVLRR